jgi:hypothetical protein
MYEMEYYEDILEWTYSWDFITLLADQHCCMAIKIPIKCSSFLNHYFLFNYNFKYSYVIEARGSVIGWGTMLQAER